MVDNTDRTHTYSETRVEKTGIGTGVLAFIVGGLVVAVALIFFVFTGDGGGSVPATGGGDVNVTVGDGDPGVEGPGILPDPGVEGPGVVVDRGAPDN